MNTEAWNLVEGALEELALAFNRITELNDAIAQAQFKAETMILMIRQEELLQEYYQTQQT